MLGAILSVDKKKKKKKPFLTLEINYGGDKRFLHDFLKHISF